MEKLSLSGTSHATPDGFAALSAVIVTPEEVFLDNGAIHGKSRVERGIQFIAKTPEEVVGGTPVYVVWVTLQTNDGAKGYNGITASKLVIHKEAQAGYKSLPDLVNKMDAAMKGKRDVSVIPREDLDRLAVFMKQFRSGDLWANAAPGVHALFA